MFVDITQPLIDSPADTFITKMMGWIDENLEYQPLLKHYASVDAESYVVVFSCDRDAVLFRLYFDL